MPDVFCLASNDEDFATLAECTRRKGHDDHHCDGRKKLAWDENGGIDCYAGWGGYDHGQPTNRAARRANVTHRPAHLARIRRDYGRG